MPKNKKTIAVFTISGIPRAVTALTVIALFSLVLIFNRDLYSLAGRTFSFFKKTNAPTVKTPLSDVVVRPDEKTETISTKGDIELESKQLYLVKDGTVAGEMNRSYQNGIFKFGIRIAALPDIKTSYLVWFLKSPGAGDGALLVGELSKLESGEYKNSYVLGETFEEDLREYLTIVITPKINDEKEIVKTKMAEGSFD